MEQSIRTGGLIGKNIRRHRKARGYTQEQLAAKLQTTGCDLSRGTLAKIEAGIRHLSLPELEAIRAALGMDYADFFTKTT